MICAIGSYPFLLAGASGEAFAHRSTDTPPHLKRLFYLFQFVVPEQLRAAVVQEHVHGHVVWGAPSSRDRAFPRSSALKRDSRTLTRRPISASSDIISSPPLRGTQRAVPVRAGLSLRIGQPGGDAHTLGPLFFQVQDAPVVRLHHPGRNPRHGRPSCITGRSMALGSPTLIPTRGPPSLVCPVRTRRSGLPFGQPTAPDGPEDPLGPQGQRDHATFLFPFRNRFLVYHEGRAGVCTLGH